MKPACNRGGERGFALLLVFVMAAVIAITLYMEMPRVAFESQRAREQLLVDRGNQYKRGIQLFYRKFKRFPARIEDLESTSNLRFLRRRYKDPMTGKDDWRIVHVGPGGFLTDSLVQKPNPLGKDPKDQLAGSGSPGNTPSSSDPNGQPAAPQLNANGTEGGGINMATARRPSDQMIVGAPGGGPGWVQPNPTDPNQPGPPQYAPPSQNAGQLQPQFPGQYMGPLLGQQGQGQPPQGQPQIAGQPPQYPGQPQFPGTPQYPGQPQFPGQPQYPGQQFPPAGQPYGRGNPTSGPPFPGVIGQPVFPGQPGQPGFPPGQIQPGQMQPGQSLTFQPGQPGPNPSYPPQPYPNQPQPYPSQPPAGGQFQGNQFPINQQQGGFASPGGFGGGQQNAAIAAIQQSLFSPRPPPAGIGGTTENGLTGGGVAIAGVASTYKGQGIKRVNEKSKYQEWEFVYDLKQDKTIMGNAAGQQMPPQPGPGQGPGNSPFAPAPPTVPTSPNPSTGPAGRPQP